MPRLRRWPGRTCVRTRTPEHVESAAAEAEPSAPPDCAPSRRATRGVTTVAFSAEPEPEATRSSPPPRCRSRPCSSPRTRPRPPPSPPAAGGLRVGSEGAEPTGDAPVRPPSGGERSNRSGERVERDDADADTEDRGGRAATRGTRTTAMTTARRDVVGAGVVDAGAGAARAMARTPRRPRMRAARRAPKQAPTQAGQPVGGRSTDQSDRSTRPEDESEDDSNDDSDDESEGGEGAESSSTRRRRRRRRRAGVAEEMRGPVRRGPAVTVVQVREPPPPGRGPRVRGSTRLEAKRQRRRDGREQGAGAPRS